MITITIVAVHPTVTIVRTDSGQTEIPSDWFPTTPKIGQEWKVDITHVATEAEKLDQLNAYLVRD